MSVAIDLLIVFGKDHYGKTEIGSTMGLVAVLPDARGAAFEVRDETASILGLETFDNKTVNLTAVVEIALAVLIARGAFLPSLLGTVTLTGTQWLIGAAPALLLFTAWELAKLLARHQSSSTRAAAPTVAIPANAPA